GAGRHFDPRESPATPVIFGSSLHDLAQAFRLRWNRLPESGETGGNRRGPMCAAPRDVSYCVCYNSSHLEWISTTSPHFSKSQSRAASRALAKNCFAPNRPSALKFASSKRNTAKSSLTASENP